MAVSRVLTAAKRLWNPTENGDTDTTQAVTPHGCVRGLAHRLQILWPRGSHVRPCPGFPPYLHCADHTAQAQGVLPQRQALLDATERTLVVIACAHQVRQLPSTGAPAGHQQALADLPAVTHGGGEGL
jgi:hypothetical protein